MFPVLLFLHESPLGACGDKDILARGSGQMAAAECELIDRAGNRLRFTATLRVETIITGGHNVVIIGEHCV